MLDFVIYSTVLSHWCIIFVHISKDNLQKYSTKSIHCVISRVLSHNLFRNTAISTSRHQMIPFGPLICLHEGFNSYIIS